ncbi:MAG TPA: glycosyltransferase family 9 protein [Chloroflexia bacterium]|nr:glycosyltransferase family 9 protein [Chloroflexia bacterium]
MPDSSAPGHATYKRILAVKLADLGDLLATTPALQALRAAQPLARIDLLTPPSSAGLLNGAPFLDNIITFDKFAFDSLGSMLNLKGVLHTARFVFRLHRIGYDALVIFHHFTTGWGSLKFAVLSLASGARVRAGLDNGRGRFLTHKVTDKGFGAMHEADYWLSVASLLGADAHAGWWPFVPINSAHRATATSLLDEIRASHTGPVIAIHPGAGAYSLARIWPVEGFAEVARGLIDAHDAAIIVLGGPDEVERAERLVEMVGYNERVHNLAGRTTIHETAALIERCDLFLGNDSGPMHIAAAVGTPVVAIFGPSNAQAWGPYTPPGEASKHTIVARALPCMPCFYRVHSLGLREGCGTRPCLTGLSVRRVLEACTTALERIPHAT